MNGDQLGNLIAALSMAAACFLGAFLLVAWF